jgi:hypothetical protein
MIRNFKLIFALCAAFSSAVALAQNAGTHTQMFFGSGISVSTVNGQTVAYWNGEQVFPGPTKGKVFANCFNMNGTQYAAAFNGDTVIWENVPGAAEHFK